MVVDYMSRWIEAIPTRTNYHKIVLKVSEKNILFGLEVQGQLFVMRGCT